MENVFSFFSEYSKSTLLLVIQISSQNRGCLSRIKPVDFDRL